MMHALGQAGALQALQSPVDAVSSGDEPIMEPPRMAALFHFAHIRKESSATLANWALDDLN
jgi:hypothetical protein